MNKAIVGGALGALAMYFLDPVAGRRRRARTGDSLRHAMKVANEAGKVTARDTAQRAQGLLATTRHLLGGEVDVPDAKLVERVRAALGRVVSHKEPERADKPELSEAQRILAAEAARREALFEQSMQAEQTRDDALARRFEEALKQAKQEPITKPTRDFDLD